MRGPSEHRSSGERAAGRNVIVTSHQCTSVLESPSFNEFAPGIFDFAASYESVDEQARVCPNLLRAHPSQEIR